VRCLKLSSLNSHPFDAPSNNGVQQTVRPVTSVAGQRPRQADPQLTLECWTDKEVYR